jgi:prepilin-type N-terminal cleavage/methylation domain-containing protein
MLELRKQKVEYKNNMHKQMQKGFTLIELLVVIAIVAVLSVVVILTLNPAELLRQARDANRVSDMSTLKSAISLYLADYSTPSIGTANTCYMSAASSGGAGATCGGRYGATTVGTSSASRAVNGTGWIPVDFTKISSGAPLGNLPVDPINDVASGMYYTYAPSSTFTFELTTKMESSRYNASGTGDVVSTDGGRSNTIYEVGTVPGLSM